MSIVLQGTSNKRSVCTVALAFLLLVSFKASSEELIVIVDLKFIEVTEKPASYLCFDDDECGVWASFYLYEAKVRKVISGQPPSKRFLVLYGRHALKRQAIRNKVARLKRLETDDPSEPQYQIVQWGKKRKMYCFERRKNDQIWSQVKLNEKEQLNCYETVRRNDS